MTALGDLLDGLEAAAKAATPGEWTQHGSMIAASGTDTIVDCWEACEDAACIVAEHDATPALVAALRAVLAVCERQEQGRDWAWASTAQIRNAVTRALGAES